MGKSMKHQIDSQNQTNIELNTKNGLLSTKKKLYMDEAISETKFGMFNYVLIFLSSLIVTVTVAEKTTISYLFPLSECDLHLTSTQKGTIGALNSLGMIVSFHLWGFLADTLGRRLVILPTLFMAFLISMGSAIVQDFHILAALRFFNGFFISGSSATIFVYLSEFHNKAKRSQAILACSVLSGAFSILIPMAAWFIINQRWELDVPSINFTYRPWRLLFIVCAVPEIVSVLMLLFMPESPKFLLDKGKHESVYEILKRMNRWNNGKCSELESLEVAQEPTENQQQISHERSSQRFAYLNTVWNQTVPLFKRPLLRSTGLVCFVQFSILYIAQGMNVFTPDILNKMAINSPSLVNQRNMMCDTINMPPKAANYSSIHAINQVCVPKLELTMVHQGITFQVLFLIAFLLTCILINRISKFSIMATFLIGGGMCGIICMWTDIPLLQISLYTMLMVTGAASYVLNTITVDLYPTSLRGMAVCISLLAGRVGCMLGSYATGHLIGKHCEMTFYICGIMLLVAAAFTFFIPNIHKKLERSVDL